MLRTKFSNLMQTHRNSTNVSAWYAASLRQGITQLTLTNQIHAIQDQNLETKCVNDGLMTLWVSERRKSNWREKQWVWRYESASEENQIDAKNSG